MRTKIIIAGVVLLAFALFTAPHAFGCVPDDSDPSRCVYFPASHYPTPVSAPLNIAAADPPAQPTPTGNSPETARDPIYVKPDNCIDAMCPEQRGAPALTAAESWTWIDANSSTWYKVNDGHGFQVKFWLFANGQQGLSFEVFAPEQQNLWEAKPIGRGSFNKSQANIGADLFYSGRSQASGIWHIRVINGNSVPVSYSVRFTRTLPTMSNVCDSCHKLIGTDWGSCQGDMCSQLHQYYDTNPTCYSHNVGADMSGGCQ